MSVPCARRDRRCRSCAVGRTENALEGVESKAKEHFVKDRRCQVGEPLRVRIIHKYDQAQQHGNEALTRIPSGKATLRPPCQPCQRPLLTNFLMPTTGLVAMDK